MNNKLNYNEIIKYMCMYYDITNEEIVNLLNTKEKLPEEIDGMSYRQLSLFDDVRFGAGMEDQVSRTRVERMMS